MTSPTQRILTSTGSSVFPVKPSSVLPFPSFDESVQAAKVRRSSAASTAESTARPLFFPALLTILPLPSVLLTVSFPLLLLISLCCSPSVPSRPDLLFFVFLYVFRIFFPEICTERRKTPCTFPKATGPPETSAPRRLPDFAYTASIPATSGTASLTILSTIV